jgi:hypothetical protein
LNYLIAVAAALSLKKEKYKVCELKKQTSACQETQCTSLSLTSETSTLSSLLDDDDDASSSSLSLSSAFFFFFLSPESPAFPEVGRSSGIPEME